MKSKTINDQFLDHLDSLARFSNLEKELIVSKSKLVELNPGEFFLKQEEKSERVGFVIDGILRYYVVNKRKEEITAHFHRENEFIADSASFFKGVPSEGSIQSEMRCRILIFEKEDFTYLENMVPNWRLAISNFTTEFLFERIAMQRSIINGRAQESYEKLIYKCPEILHNVALGHIASYLGITQSTLSRIRKRLVTEAA